MLSCQQLTELCTDYLERRMSRIDRLRFQFHLALCKACRAYLGQMQTTLDTLGYLPAEDMPPEVKAELLEVFRDWHETN